VTGPSKRERAPFPLDWQRRSGISHLIQGARVANLRGALLHFKFLDDFAANVQREIAREQYWNKAQEYKGYGAVLSRDPNLNLMSPISEKFVSSSQLVTLGVMKTSTKFVEYRYPYGDGRLASHREV
jgi:hypothetical protein